MLRRKRLLLIAIALLGITCSFWIFSRYPQLNQKAAMVAALSPVSDTLTTWPLLKIRHSDSLVRRVTYTTVNWYWENRKGMTFGVILASLFVTLFGYFKVRHGTRSYLNTFYGVLLGSPLAVCVNCAAPVFKGVLRSRRVETALATMLSSPTMNIVVLTMVFTVFPLYLAVTKVLFTLATIFIFVPAMSRILGPGHIIRDLKRLDEKAGGIEELPGGPEAESWSTALPGAARDLAKNFFHIVITTVPLMFLGGFLGALLSHLVPTNAFVSWTASLPVLMLASLVGTLLPVPMAFDVMLASALFSLGMPAGLVLVFLCTLGIYSVYSLFVVWSSASRAWALGLFAWVGGLGVAVGALGAPLHERFYVSRNLAEFRAHRDPAQDIAIEPEKSAPFSPPLPPAPTAVFRDVPASALKTSGGGLLSWAPFVPKAVPPPQPRFIKKEGQEIGLVRGYRSEIRDYPDPFWLGRGTAAGDVNGDGWNDIAFGTNFGYTLYLNRGGWFEQQELRNQDLQRLRVYAVAFADMNNDGWLDLFFTTYDHGNFVVINRSGELDQAHPLPVPNGGGVITATPAFADLDGNGYPDVVNGNMALGIVTGFFHYGRGRETTITYNDALKFSEGSIAAGSSADMGETMSTLIADINGDGSADIYLGHDFTFPDQLFLGNPGRTFHEVTRADRVLSHTPFFSMSADSGDVNNDLAPDLLISGTIAQRDWVGSGPIDGVAAAEYGREKWAEAVCDGIKDPIVRANCHVIRDANHNFRNPFNVDLGGCQKFADPGKVQTCLLSLMWIMITRDPMAQALCEEKYHLDPLIKSVCKVLAQRKERARPEDFPGSFTQVDDSILYLARGGGRFAPLKTYRHPGGWTWNTKIADLDDDGWQDIFSTDAVLRERGVGWNVFMKNAGGQRFEQRQFSYNLVDDFGLLSYALIDYNGDGSLDIIGNSSVGPVQVYENHATEQNHSVTVSLRDLRGNRFGIGAKVFIRYGEGLAQMREIKAGGGYMSFDPYEAHFGLGGHAGPLGEISVQWAGGGESYFRGALPADRHYRVERPATN